MERSGGGLLCEACYHSSQRTRSITRAPPGEPRTSWVELGNERWEKAKRTPHGYVPRQPPPPPPPSVAYRYIGLGPPEPPRYSPKVEVPGWVPPWERPSPDRRTHVTLPEARAHLCVGKHASAHELDVGLERRIATISRSELLQPSDKAERCRKLRDAHGLLVTHLAHLEDLAALADLAASPPLPHEPPPPPHVAVPLGSGPSRWQRAVAVPLARPLPPPAPPAPPPPPSPSVTYRYIVVPYERKQRRQQPLSYRIPPPPPPPPQPAAADRRKKPTAKDPHYIPPWERAVPRKQKEPPKAKPVPRPPPEMARLVEVASL